MKIFVICHPKLGYLAGNKSYRYWTPKLQMARKWNRRCDAEQSRIYTETDLLLNESQVHCIEFDYED